MNGADLAGVRWRKSSRSNQQGGDSVEVAFLDDGQVAIRDSKDAGRGPALVFTPAEWAAFTAGVHNNEFTYPRPKILQDESARHPD